MDHTKWRARSWMPWDCKVDKCHHVLNALITDSYDSLLKTAQQLIEKSGVDEEEAVLVHEAWLYMRQLRIETVLSKALFINMMRKSMEQVLLEFALHPNLENLGFSRETMAVSGRHPVSVISLTQALAKMAEERAKEYKVIRLRFFQDMTWPEIALKMNVSESTTKRLWRTGRNHLTKVLREADADLVWRTIKMPLKLNLKPQPLPPLTN